MNLMIPNKQNLFILHINEVCMEYFLKRPKGMKHQLLWK